ncbi:hypothetical protein ACEWY4_024411 [Coilia grayii]|uniref:Putative nuclease HARBI1 n=1 Tax=Coilia grayii TaxID=363190 RepID=A0ABD1J090_9TELE
MAARQRIVELNDRRRHGRRSQTVYVNAFIRSTFSPLDVLSDEALIRKYRLNREVIQELCALVQPHLVRATRRNFALSPTVQLLAALRFYASGSFFEVLGDGLGLSRSSISRAVTAVTQVLLQLTARVTFPVGQAAIARVNEGFHTIAGIPRVIGAVDGTLIPIASPSENEPIYICRKGFAAVNVQVVCDHEGRFTDVVAKWPGSTHDSFMWANCGLRQVAEDGGFGGCWLLGDSGYPLRPFLLTPFLQANTPAEVQYNIAHSRSRTVVERAIGVWKQRFRCLSKTAGGLQLHPTKCCAIVVATAILHNMAVQANVQLPDDVVLMEEPDADHLPADVHPAGVEARQQLLQHMFGP